mmetsp:Transcript_15398/g.18745  ORF Transcript_15398/g.18745 Transcript_15398/m.18745 type:complete len:465 (+) Transcript_15398:175-1569(+)
MTTTNSSAVEEKEDKLTVKMSLQHIRVAVIGNVDAGKSTLIGTLKTGRLDDGRGQSRQTIMKHNHEIETGRTSTITSHLIGYNEDGHSVGFDQNSATTSQMKSDYEIASEATQLVSLVDLAGHEKYLKSTIHGISSGMIDYALVLINANHPPNHMTCHHIGISIASGIPIIIVLTKIDNCPKHALKNTKDEIANILRCPGVQKKTFQIKQASDISLIKDKMHALTPLVSISSVSGEGLHLLHDLLNALPKRRCHQNKAGRTLEYLVEDTFNITGVGVVVSGFVNAGRSRVGDTVFVGPMSDKSFIKTRIKSIHIARTNVSSVMAGNSACLGLALSKDQRNLLRRGMVVLETPLETTQVFEAEIVIIKGSGVDGTTIKVGYETMAHILHVRQHVKIEHINVLGNEMCKSSFDEHSATIRPGHRAKVTFRFLQRPEFIRTGMKMLFRDGHIRGVGIVTKLKTIYSK